MRTMPFILLPWTTRQYRQTNRERSRTLCTNGSKTHSKKLKLGVLICVLIMDSPKAEMRSKLSQSYRNKRATNTDKINILTRSRESEMDRWWGGEVVRWGRRWKLKEIAGWRSSSLTDNKITFDGTSISLSLQIWMYDTNGKTRIKNSRQRSTVLKWWQGGISDELITVWWGRRRISFSFLFFYLSHRRLYKEKYWKVNTILLIWQFQVIWVENSSFFFF